MLREEWTALTGHDPTPEQWGIINTVYTWHPVICNVDGKKQMQALFKTGGYPLIKSLHQDAQLAQDIEVWIRNAHAEYERNTAALRDEIACLEAAINAARIKYQKTTEELKAQLDNLKEGR